MNILKHFNRFQTPILFLIGMACVGITSLSLIRGDFFRPHDYTHAARIVEMNRSLVLGEFPVRWSQNFGFGYGMPLFNFYAPLPYYVAQIPFALTQNAIISIKFLYVLNSIFAFIGMYLFAKEVWGKKGGIVSAVLFTFSTYRAVDLFVRGAIGEATAMVLLPFALYGVARLRTHKKQGVLIIALSLAAILLSHNLIGMISVGIIGIYGICSVGRKKILPLFSSIVLSGVLSAFYILPAFFEKDFTRVEATITTGYFDFHNHFVALRQFIFGVWGYGGSQLGLEDGISFAVGYIPLLILALSGVAVLLTKRKIRTFSLLAFFLVGSVFMASNKSIFIWEQVKILKYMQFPWRFLTFTHVFLAVLGGGIVIWSQKLKQQTAILMSVGALTLMCIGLQSRYFVPEKYITNTDEFYSTEPFFIHGEMSKTLNDYLPKTISDESLPGPTDERIVLMKGDGWILITQDTPTKVSSHVTCSVECEVRFNIFQFPGWKGWVDGQSVSLTENADFPVYSTILSSGEHDVTVQLMDTPIRRVGNVLSLMGWGFVVVIVGLHYAKRTIKIRS